MLFYGNYSGMIEKTDSGIFLTWNFA